MTRDSVTNNPQDFSGILNTEFSIMSSCTLARTKHECWDMITLVIFHAFLLRAGCTNVSFVFVCHNWPGLESNTLFLRDKSYRFYNAHT